MIERTLDHRAFWLQKWQRRALRMVRDGQAASLTMRDAQWLLAQGYVTDDASPKLSLSGSELLNYVERKKKK